MSNRIGLKNSFMNTTWNKTGSTHTSGVTTKSQTIQKNDGWHHSSYAAEGNKTSKWGGSFSTGGSTSDLFRPTPGKPNFLTNLLGKLPAWEKKGEFGTGVAAMVKEGSFKSLGGLAEGEGRISLLEASVHGKGSVAFKDGALSAKGEVGAQATLIDAGGRIRLGKGDYGLDAAGSVFVGAKANAKGELVIDPKNGIYAARVGGEAFAGARAAAEANVNLGKFGSVGGRAEAWAGVGAAFHAEAGFKNGRFKARFDIGAALGIGFKLGFNVDINVKGIVDAVKAPFKAIGDLAKKGIDTVKNVAGNVVDGVKNAAKAVGNGVKSAAKAVGNFFKSIF